MCDCCEYVAARGGRPHDPKLVAEYNRVWRRRTRERICEYGFTVMSIDNEWPPFSYTIGLWGLGHPELVVFGLDPEKGPGLLNLIGDGIRDSGVALEHEHRLQVGDWLFEARQLPNPGEVLLRANTYYRRPPSRAVPALQLLYPDVHGVWPWEPHCHLFPGQQPMPGMFAA